MVIYALWVSNYHLHLQCSNARIGPQLEDFTNGALFMPVFCFQIQVSNCTNIKIHKIHELAQIVLQDGDNEDYSSNTNVAEIDAVRAVLIQLFRFIPSKQCQCLHLDSGFYTLQVEDTSGASGIELQELTYHLHLPLLLMFQQEVWYKQPNTCLEVFRLQEPARVKFSFVDEGHPFLNIMYLML